MTERFTESVVEQAALAWLESTGWLIRNGAEITPGQPTAERIIGRVC
jgi:type I restriction enzyme R subunit